MKSNIVVTLRVAGLHAWPGVRDTKYTDSVGYLQFPHRHEFYIRCEKTVSHANRDIEIIDLKAQIYQYILNQWKGPLHSNTVDFGTMSCEMIAENLIEQFHLDSCEVLEDGENGAICYNNDVEKQRDQTLRHQKYWNKVDELLTTPIKPPTARSMTIQQQIEFNKVFGDSQSITKLNHGKNITFICSYLQGGKSVVARALATELQRNYYVGLVDGVTHIEVSDIVKYSLQVTDRESLQGHPELDQIIIQKIDQASKKYKQVVVSGPRQLSILQAFPMATLIWIDTPHNVRLERYKDSIKDNDKSIDGFSAANSRDVDLGINQVRQYIFDRQAH